jgi:hypothetical protein
MHQKSQRCIQQEDDMVMVISEAQARQEMILLRRENEFDRLMALEWPRLIAQLADYGLRVQVDVCFVRTDAEVQLRVACQAPGVTRSYGVVLNHPDCIYVLREGDRTSNIMSSRNLTQILFDKVYNQTRPAQPLRGAWRGAQSPT